MALHIAVGPPASPADEAGTTGMTDTSGTPSASGEEGAVPVVGPALPVPILGWSFYEGRPIVTGSGRAIFVNFAGGDAVATLDFFLDVDPRVHYRIESGGKVDSAMDETSSGRRVNIAYAGHFLN
jgi:hypothetical protein